MQIEQVIPLWRAALESEHAPRTIASYTDHMRTFTQSLGSDPLIEAITAARIEAHKRHLTARCGPKTIGLALTGIRSFCRYLVASGLRIDDPTLHVRFPKAAKALPRALTRTQVRQLVASLDVPDGLHPVDDYQWRRNRLAILLMLYAGFRISEVQQLRVGSVQLEQARIVIREGKGDKDRVVPLHLVLVGELRLALEGKRDHHAVCGHAHGPCLADKSMHHIFERWVPRLGLSFHLTSHQLRHTFITELIDRGANIFEAQELAGHESPETTRIYYRLSADHLRAAVNRLPSTW